MLITTNKILNARMKSIVFALSLIHIYRAMQALYLMALEPIAETNCVHCPALLSEAVRKTVACRFGYRFQCHEI